MARLSDRLDMGSEVGIWRRQPGGPGCHQFQWRRRAGEAGEVRWEDSGGQLGCGPAWTCVFCFTAVVEGLQVTVPDKRKVAMLFQPAVLRCHFSTSSHRPAVVQWKFKSYCQDRMGESLGMSSTRAQSLSKRNLEWDPYLDCLDSRRTVRVVASKQGSTVTLGDFYRGREITIVHGTNARAWNLGHGGRAVPFFTDTRGLSLSLPQALRIPFDGR